ncbi:MAG: hypothetical protein U0Q16_22145 [Bryobacteraceae bacterium]
MYPIIVVPDGAAVLSEQLGTKAKFWFDGRTRLCKLARMGTGEDWSEKVAAEIAAALEIPHAYYDLVTWRGRPCAVSYDFLAHAETLVRGNELIRQEYSEALGRFHQSGHTVELVFETLQGCGCLPPSSWPIEPGISSATGVFVAYLMLDALIGNTDRHHENWGVIESGESENRLCPSFDHASCLGRELTDSERRTRLDTRDRNYSVERFAERARSGLYRKGEIKPLLTVDAFMTAAQLEPVAALQWLRKLAQIDTESLRKVLLLVPDERLPESAREFASRMLLHNRGRLLDLDFAIE